MSRYSIGKTALYDRINALGLKLEKTTIGSFANAEQTELLDRMNNFIKSGGKIVDFVAQQHLSKQSPNDQPVADSECPTKTSLSTTSSNNTKVLDSSQGQAGQTEVLIKAIAYLMNQQSSDEFYAWQKLEEVAKHNWHIPTSQLLLLLSRATIPPLDDHQRFSRMGFTFTRVGKLGREYEWRVSKVQP